MAALREWFERLSSEDKSETSINPCDCLGHCEKGINIKVKDTVVNEVTVENLEQKIQEGEELDAKGRRDVDIDAVMKALDNF